jgi:hypothetical protein
VTTCDECEIIAREINESLAELKRHLDLTEQDRRLAVEALLGGTEADALRFEELVSRTLALEGAALSTRMNRAMGGRCGMKREAATESRGDRGADCNVSA